MNAALFMVFVCCCSNFSVIGLIVAIIVQQLFSLGLFVLQIAMSIYTWITLGLSIANMALFVFFYVAMFRFVQDMCMPIFTMYDDKVGNSSSDSRSELAMSIIP